MNVEPRGLAALTAHAGEATRELRARELATARDLAVCRQMIRDGSKSFFAASLLLPADLRLAVSALYAFCRLSDDTVDTAGASAPALEHLRIRLDRAYAGRPFPHPVDRAFAWVTSQYGIPRRLPEALLEGFAWDLDGRRYQTLDELNAYGARVAGTVGVMMCVIMGAREPRTLARACDLGAAMQLTNIARDVGEDACEGRVYLPLDWLAEEGLKARDIIAARRLPPVVANVVVRLLDAAQDLYARAATGIARLPPPCRPAIEAARLVYAEIGAEIRRNALDSLSRRAVVSKPRKIALAGRAIGAHAFAMPALMAPCDPAPPPAGAGFLIEAVERAPVSKRDPKRIATRHPSADPANLERIIELMGRLEQRDRNWRRARLAMRA